MPFTELVHQRQFTSEKIEPVYERWLEIEIAEITQIAKKDLEGVRSLALDSSVSPGAFDQRVDMNTIGNAVMSAAALSSAAAAVPVFTSMSVVSAGGVLGLLGATTISAPIVAAGIATTGLLASVGVYKGTHLKRNATEAYRKAMHKSVQERLLGHRHDGSSVREQLQQGIMNSAASLLEEIDQC
jgi:hypothetical protein